MVPLGPALDLATGWSLLGGLILSLGAVFNRWLILPRVGGLTGSSERREALAILARVCTLGSGMILGGLAFLLLRQFLEFRDPFAPGAEELRLLLTTPWGSVWKGGLLALLLGALGIATAGRIGLPAWGLASVAFLGLGVFPGLTGHAAGASSGRTLALAADALHVWAAGAWVGGLAVVLALDSAVGRRLPAFSLPVVVPLFSPVALTGAAVLCATGAMAAYREVDAVSALWATPYGRLLTLKVGLVAAVLALGALNWRGLTPRLGTESGDRALRRAARVELLVANAVLLATALLIRTSPGGH